MSMWRRVIVLEACYTNKRPTTMCLGKKHSGMTCMNTGLSVILLHTWKRPGRYHLVGIGVEGWEASDSDSHCVASLYSTM